MKKLLIVPFLLLCFMLQAQVARKSNPQVLPAFDIVQANGQHYTLLDLPAGKPVMIVYFDPDCDHCELFIGQLLKQFNSFSNTQILLITYVSVPYLKAFVQKHDLGKYPGLITGTEGNSFIVRYHYDVIQFPYVALHDKKGMLIARYESEVPPPEDLAKLMK
jgi:peroxiredoxin